jgi:hypothetical protein
MILISSALSLSLNIQRYDGEQTQGPTHVQAFSTTLRSPS